MRAVSYHQELRDFMAEKKEKKPLLQTFCKNWQTMDFGEKISASSSFVTFFGVPFVAWQINLAINSIEDNAQNFLSSGVQEINKVFIEKPELWPYFEEGLKASKEDKNYNAVMALADMHIDFFDALWIQTDNIDSLYEGDDWNSWNNWIMNVTKNSPNLCERFDDTKRFYSKGFANYLLKGCESS